MLLLKKSNVADLPQVKKPRFLAEAGLMDRDVTYGVSRPRSENRRETAAIEDADVTKVIQSVKPGAYASASHRAILSVGFYAGLRSNEIRQLRMSDIGTLKGIKILRLRIKGDKAHEIPLHPVVLTALDEHLKVLRSRGFAVEDPGHVLFPSLKTGLNVAMSDEAIRYIFNVALDRAGIVRDSFKRYSPHSTRATFTTHLLDTAEVPVEHVQQALGHASPETTLSYNKRKRGHDKSA
ncbi:MAG: site-specific integrase, partial [Methanosarcinales archaeon]